MGARTHLPRAFAQTRPEGTRQASVGFDQGRLADAGLASEQEQEQGALPAPRTLELPLQPLTLALPALQHDLQGRYASVLRAVIAAAGRGSGGFASAGERRAPLVTLGSAAAFNAC
jgi:hypothetical protein